MSFNACILKLTSICNLNCTYCYMFNSPDRTFERVSALMPIEVALASINEIRGHLTVCETKRFTITLHGGEPTLWPTDRFARLFAQIESVRQQGFEIDLNLQTNAYRPIKLDLLKLLAAHRVSIGISVDGPAVFNDSVRVTHSGKGSYDHVMANVRQLIESGYDSLIGGFLTVANPQIPPADFLDWVACLPVKRVDVLWPIQFNIDSPPWGPSKLAYEGPPVYGVWFAELFREWLERDDPNLYVRSFFNLVELRLGGLNHIDALVNDQLAMFVINTDGRIEYPDYLRSAADEIANSGLNILTSDLCKTAREPIFRKLFDLKSYLPAECNDCPHVRVCGGGFLAGRSSRSEVLSDRRSVLCADQYHFFSFVARQLSRFSNPEQIVEEPATYRPNKEVKHAGR